MEVDTKLMRQMLYFTVYLLACSASSAFANEVAFLAYEKGFWQVFLMGQDGSRQKQVSFSPYDKNKISWYPSGKYLLLNGSQGELVKLEIETGNETPLNIPLEPIADAMISPNGKQVAFSISAAGPLDRNDIWIANEDGSELRKLTRMKGLQHEPVWSNDGKDIYFLSGIVGANKQHHDVFRLTLSNNAIEQLTSSALYHFDIALSREGDIAFSNNRSGDYEIWLKQSSGQSTQVTNSPGVDAKPNWSPDGEKLIFESTRSGVPNIWMYDLKSGETKQITRQKIGARNPVWFSGAKS